jgi:hypothetical protein
VSGEAYNYILFLKKQTISHLDLMYPVYNQAQLYLFSTHSYHLSENILDPKSSVIKLNNVQELFTKIKFLK